VAVTHVGRPSRLAPPRQYEPATAEASCAMPAAGVAAAPLEPAPQEGPGDDDNEDSEWAEFTGAEDDRPGSSSGEPAPHAVDQQPPKAEPGAGSQPDHS
jgi:hypothetical protein